MKVRFCVCVCVFIGQHDGPLPRQHAGLLPESLIWAYIVQLSSALRTIHTAGLACRVMDPTKILITGKTRYWHFELWLLYQSSNLWQLSKHSMMICFNSTFSYIPSRRTAVTLSSFVSVFFFLHAEFVIKCLVINQDLIGVWEVCMVRVGGISTSVSTSFVCTTISLRFWHEPPWSGEA